MYINIDFTSLFSNLHHNPKELYPSFSSVDIEGYNYLGLHCESYIKHTLKVAVLFK